MSSAASGKTHVAEEMDRAETVLSGLIGKTIDTISIQSSDQSEASFLAKNVSKLSPLVGNLVENLVVSELEQRLVDGNMEWRRQDPYFPDAALFSQSGVALGAGFEVKAWYAMSTEMTGRFRESRNLLEGKDIRLLVVSWGLSHIVFGKPVILDVVSVPGVDVAECRDAHYHKPPNYLILEPEDTTGRASNLQQSNVNGYRLQGMASKEAVDVHSGSAARDEAPHTAKAQHLARKLHDLGRYRMDTNFAKIDRIDHEALEEFKERSLASRLRGRSMAEWSDCVQSLDSGSDTERVAATLALSALYQE